MNVQYSTVSQTSGLFKTIFLKELFCFEEICLAEDLNNEHGEQSFLVSTIKCHFLSKTIVLLRELYLLEDPKNKYAGSLPVSPKHPLQDHLPSKTIISTSRAWFLWKP